MIFAGKEFLAPIIGSRVFVLAAVLWAAVQIFKRVGGLGKLILLAGGVLLVVGWDTERGVLRAAAGSGGDTLLMAGLVVGGILAVEALWGQPKPADEEGRWFGRKNNRKRRHR